MIVGALILWTLGGFIGLLLGLHIAWWDVLINTGILPSD